MHRLLETKALTIGVASRIFCKDFNIQINPHEIWGILGANGSGKTTLLHTLQGLIQPLSGDVFLKNQNLTTLSYKEIARSSGILFQNTSVPFVQTVYDYCAMARFPHFNDFTKKEHQIIITQALEDLELTHLSSQKVSTLSGGEKKRLYIAALLIQSPQLFLLDEPTNHLDIYYQIKILNHFKKISQSQPISILMSLHDINLAEIICDKIILLLDNGQWLAGATHSLLTQDNLQRVFHQTIKKEKLAWLPAF